MRWTLATMPTGLSGSACLYDGADTIYMFGGYTSASTEASTTTVYKYSIKSNKWTNLNALGTGSSDGATASQFCGACIVNGTIYVIGGEGTAAIWTYNSTTDQYTHVGVKAASDSVLGVIAFVGPYSIPSNFTTDTTRVSGLSVMC